MKAIILKAGKNARVADINPTYHNLSSLVGGRLEMTYPFEDEYIAVVCNEEAILFDLPPTRVARRADGSVAEIYCGTLVVLALAPEGEFRSLTDEEEELILRVWGKPDEHIRWGFINQEGGMRA